MSDTSVKKIKIMLKAIEETQSGEDIVLAIEAEAKKQGVEITYEEIADFLK